MESNNPNGSAAERSEGQLTTEAIMKLLGATSMVRVDSVEEALRLFRDRQAAIWRDNGAFGASPATNEAEPSESPQSLPRAN